MVHTMLMKDEKYNDFRDLPIDNGNKIP